MLHGQPKYYLTFTRKYTLDYIISYILLLQKMCSTDTVDAFSVCKPKHNNDESFTFSYNYFARLLRGPSCLRLCTNHYNR